MAFFKTLKRRKTLKELTKHCENMEKEVPLFLKVIHEPTVKQLETDVDYYKNFVVKLEREKIQYIETEAYEVIERMLKATYTVIKCINAELYKREVKQ